MVVKVVTMEMDVFYVSYRYNFCYKDLEMKIKHTN